MEKTANYKLPQWVETDPIKMKPFNDAFDDIDKALKANADAVATKAEASTVTAIAQTIANGKICRIKYGSYTGNGTYGYKNPTSLTCEFTPVLLVVVCNGSSSTHTAVTRGTTSALMGSAVNSITWGDNSISWYCDNTGVQGDKQLNYSGNTYCYVILGY